MISSYRVTVEVSFEVPAVSGSPTEAARIARILTVTAMTGASNLVVSPIHAIAVKESHPSPQPPPLLRSGKRVEQGVNE